MNINIENLIKKAFEEDLGLAGDISTDNIFDEYQKVSGEYVAKEDGIVSGLVFFRQIFNYIDPDILIDFLFKDGDIVKKGDIIAKIQGDIRSVLKIERISLNILGHLSGIATQTKNIVDNLGREDVKIVDTRKTLPGLRSIQKYAVKCGGGYNHRFGLFDAVMLKENHIKASGGIGKAVSKVQKAIGHTVKIEVETTNSDEVRQAVNAGADIIMLDNMDYNTMKDCCDIIDGRCVIEVSGNITPETVKNRVSDLPVDIVSVGSLTHSVKVLDISFLIR